MVAVKVEWSHIVAPALVGVVAGLGTEASTWLGLRDALLSVLSIISAGLLVRLARGVPFSATDVLRPDDVRKLSEAIKRSIRGLRMLLVVCFIGMLLLVFAEQLNKIFEYSNANWNLPYSDKFDYLSFLVSLILTYIAIRAYAVVDGDVQIADIQADLLVRKENKQAAESFDDGLAAPAKESYRAPKDYGRVI